MRKILLLQFVLSFMLMITNGQSINDKFFTKVSYIGAFDGTNDWTEGWAEWNPVNKDYPASATTKGNGVFTRAGGLHITASETWSGVVKLDGWVYVDAGATLTIQPGTIIRGTSKSVLVIERGGKINATGTKNNPIVMTSNQGVNFRSQSDWGGLVICGKAPNNQPGGEGIAEGGIGAPYGGTDPSDSSGVIRYLRIEFPGYEVATGSEVNGLTFYSAGSRTEVDYVQVSYSGDDAFEWFGGTVNCRHLISFKTEDDDFDTDNGFSGMVQFCVSLRDPGIVDTDTANGFESDNDASGDNATPLTAGIFSNITGVGPAKDLATYNTLPTNHKEGSSMRLRRNTRLSSFNSIWMAYGRGIRLESAGSQNATSTDQLTVKNTIIAGVFGDKYKTDDAALSASQLETWFTASSRKNQFLANSADVKLKDPFNLNAPNFQPLTGSPVFNASCWATTSSEDFKNVMNNKCLVRNYPNPFSGRTNIELILKNPAQVRIAVFNSLGTIVTELQNGRLSSGIHNFRIDGTNFSKGIYLAKIIADDKSSFLKLLVQ